MHPLGLRQRGLELLDEGRSLRSAATELGVSRAALRECRDRGMQGAERSACPREIGNLAQVARHYAALLGYYLGDGCISGYGRTSSLRVSCDERYPAVVDDVARLIVAVRGRGPVGRVRAPGCVVICAYWNHWTCLFPQHGPGRKHERVLRLEDWQEELVAADPADLLRGLFHSDGCRVTNWATRRVDGEVRRYEYGRWHFTNHSTDIQEFCTAALDRIEVPRRRSSWKTISVSRRAAVARLDELLGPKA